MPKSPTTPKKLEMMLLDASAPLEIRLEILKQLARAEDEAAAPILGELLEAAGAAKTDEQSREKLRELSEMLRAMQQGPLCCALFDRMLDQPGLGQRAQVILSDGSLASPLVPDKQLAEKMRCGDTVWIEAKGSAILFHAPTLNVVGDEARLERVHDDGYVSASISDLNRALYRPSARLREQLDAGEAETGATLIVCQRRMIAFLALPEPKGLDHYRFLSREAVPDVVVERDIGSPPAFIRLLLDHARRELEDPGVSRRYRLRRSKLTLLSGIPGSGKTHSINGLWNSLYQLVSEATGVPVEDLPPRVMRLKSSEVLSKWLGESDKQIARFFRELDQLACEIFTAPDGSEWQLPVLVIAEEIDALARSRGEDAIHDRILATLLEGLDPSRPVFRNHLVFVIATTNTSQLVDIAVIRRIGGRIETFGHMDPRSFRSVLEKLLSGLPFQESVRQRSRDVRRQTIADATAWLYAPNSDAGGQVELTMIGQANPVTQYHRHFLTAGLVDRAVQEACEAAANAEHAGSARPGLTPELVTSAIHRQVRHIVDLLTTHNCDKYLALPDGERVATVRRIAQPALIPFQLLRHEERELGRAS
jgi:ATP-dependent 26S proteasome regulatory subunit